LLFEFLRSTCSAAFHESNQVGQKIFQHRQRGD
jgi:hypothetical protein